MKKIKKRKKVLLTIAITLATVIVLYVVFCATFGGVIYPDFFKSVKTVQKIPELLKDFVPQGVTSLEGKTLVCGYSAGSGPSRIYVLDDGKSTRINLNREDGTVYEGHAGGITCCGDYVYISNASKIFVINAKDILKAADGDVVTISGYFDVPCRSSFCSCDGTYLYVGEYHAAGYETSEDHVLENSDGKYEAIVLAYRINGDAQYGVEQKPEIVYSVRDKVQGFAVKDSVAVLSCSSGLDDSHLYYYDISGNEDGQFEYEGEKLPLYVLNSGRENRAIKVPHMSEDLEFTERGLLIGFEAGAKKFGGGLLPFSIKDIMLFNG